MRSLLTFAIVIAAGAGALAQGRLASSEPAEPAFEIVSVNRGSIRHRPDGPHGPLRLRAGILSCVPASAVSSAGASLFTALTEQLGLRLRPETIVAPVLVIDRVERPAPDP